MPRREPLNEKIIRALESRQEHFRALNSGEHFAYGRAIDIVRRHHGNITNPATQLKKYKDITNRIFGVIIKVCNGEAPEEMPPPTPRQLQQAAARGPLLWHNPPPVGAGSWAILITLYRRTDASMPRGPPYLTKNQIIAMAVEEVGVNLDDSTRGFSKWKGVDTCENKKWIVRDRRSRQFGGRNGGQWGGAKDTFCLTEEGKQLANILSQQEQASRQPGQRRPGAAAAMSAGAAAAQRYDEELGEGGDGEEGPEPFQPYAAAGGAAAGARAPVFTGRGQLLGGSPAPAARLTSAAAAGAGRARHRGPTEANRGGIFGAWEDDIDGLFCPANDAGYESDTSPAAAAAASRRRSTADAAATAMPACRPSAAAAAAAGSPAARRRLLPRVKASERALPLCADGKCEQCDTLRTFRDGQMDMMHIANLSKAKQQHVKQVASWLAAPEGGGNLLSVTDGPGKALVLHRRAPADSRPTSQEPGHAAGGAATGGAGGNPDPLGELSKLLSQRQSAQARSNPPAAPATAAAAAAADVARDFASLQADLFGPAAAAAASRGLLDGLGGDHMLGFTAAAAAAAAAAVGGRAGNADADEDWLLDGEDIQEQAALLEAAAAARRQSQPAPTQQQQQQQAPAAAASDDGLTPAMRAAAAAEARMRQHQSHQPPRSAGPAAGKPQQQPQQQQQQGRVPEPVVIADTQLEEQVLAETEDLDAWLAQQQQQQQDMPRPRLRQQQQPTNAHNGTAAGAAAAAAAAAPCIVLLESQDVAMGSADDPAAAAAGSKSAEVVGRSRKRQQPDGPSPLQVVLLDSQDEELAAAGVTGCPSGVTAAGPPRREPTSRMDVECDHAPATRRRRQQPQQQLEEEDGSLQSSQQQRREEGGAGVAGRAATASPSVEILDTQVEMWDLPNDDLAAAAGGGVGAAAGTSGVSDADRYGAGVAARQPSAAGAAAAAGGLAGSRAASPAADAARRTDRRQRQSAAADAAAFELKLVVDEKERIQNPDPNHIYSSLRREHLAALHSGVMPDSVTVDVDRDDLPLGDYMWLVLPQDQQEPSAAAGSSRGRQSRGRSGGDGGASDGNAGEEEDEETAAAAERTQCLVAGAVVERKTVRDLVSRSAKSDHLRQLQRMHYLADVLPHQLFIIENVTQLANHYVTYGALPGAAPGSSTVIDNEASLFDFIIRAAVSEYGDVQRILLAPSTADSRDILLAVTQLLLYEQQQQRRRQQQRQRRLSDANEAHGGEGLTYRELKTLCHQVSRRLLRSALDPLMGALPPGDPRPPDAAFNITRGAGGHSGLVLYHHKTYQGLRVVYLVGHSLLKLLNEFYTTAIADIRSSAEAAAAGSTAGLLDGLPAAAAAGTGAAAAPSLTINEAVTAAIEVAAMLASYLQSFLEAAGITSSSAHRSSQQQQQQHTRPCCMLVAENLVGPHGAVVYMHRVQQQACLNSGRQAATKAAAARQQEAMSLSAPAITQWLWLWLVVFVFQHDWHLHLAQSSTSVRTFLEAAGSRCAWLAEQLQEQQQGEEEVGVFGSYRLQQQQQEEVGNGRLGQRQSQQQQQRGLSAAAAGAAERGSGSDKGASFSLLGDDDTNAGDEQVWGQAEDAAWAPQRKQHAAQPQQQPGLPPGLSRGRSQKRKGHCSLLRGLGDGADSGDGSEQRGVEEDEEEVEEWLSQRQKQRQQQQQQRRWQPSRKSTGSDFMSWLEEEQGMGAQQQQQQQLVGAAAVGSGGTAAGRVVRSAHGQNGVGDADVIPDSEDDDDVIIVD